MLLNSFCRASKPGTLLIVSGLLLFCLSGKSQDQTKREKIRSLFSLMKQDSLIEKTMNNMLTSSYAQMQKQFSDTSIYNAEFREKFSAILDKQRAQAISIIKQLIDVDMVDVYDKYFTLKDVEAFIDFYKSPAGKKLIDQTPNLTKDLMSIIATKYSPALQQGLMNEMQELLKSTRQGSR